MKIALPSRDNSIDSHFGHCEYFTVFTIDEKKHAKTIPTMYNILSSLRFITI